MSMFRHAVCIRLVWVVGLAGLATGISGCDPSSLYGPLAGKWSSKTPTAIVAEPVATQQSVYVGGFGDGYEYAFDAATGTLTWKTGLGTTTALCPDSVTQGVASTPTVLAGSLYLGGGDANWYALNALTGAVQWSFPVGDNSPTGGNFNYASPLIYNGSAYVGTSSFCDNPLVQGRLLRVSLTTHQIQNVWKAVPDGQLGGTIWTTPVVDPATNTVYLTTGTRALASQTYSEAFVALDATTLALRGAWSPTGSECVDCDYDFGGSPTLFTGAGGRKLVGASNKDGVFYALDRSNLTAGPVWQFRVAAGGGCPTCGDGSISTAYFDGRYVYVAGGTTTIGGQSYGGSVRALDPATGTPVWQVGLKSPVIAGLTGQNGMVVVPDGSELYILRAATGAMVYANDLGAIGYAPVTLSGNRLFAGTMDGTLRALTFPAQDPGAQAGAASLRAPSAGAVRACLLGAPCRLDAGPRCSALAGAGAARGQEIIGLEVREAGARRRGDSVRVYGNGSCRGRPALTIALRRASRIQLPVPVPVPPEGFVSYAASRQLALRVHILTRRRSAEPPQRRPARVPWAVGHLAAGP